MEKVMVEARSGFEAVQRAKAARPCSVVELLAVVQDPDDNWEGTGWYRVRLIPRATIRRDLANAVPHSPWAHHLEDMLAS